jgi:hypothetical protein
LVDALAAAFFDVLFVEGRAATEEELPAGMDAELDDCEAGGLVVEEEFSFDFGAADCWVLGTRGTCVLSTVTLSFPLLTSLALFDVDVVCCTSFDVVVVTF